MKTPEEIKNIKEGLKSCSSDECHGDHGDCPYKNNVFCMMTMAGEAMAYIEQLEERISLNSLRDAIYEDAVAHGLWEEYYPAATDCVDFIRDEVIELEYAAMNWRNGYTENSKFYPEFCQELADVIIMCLSVAGKLGIDIDAAVRRKMEINKARPWKHGKEEKQC